MNKYYKEITPSRPWFDLRLRELWLYKDLILLFTKRNFVLFYKQTILGPLWTIINPLISSLLYLLVFGTIAQLSTDGVPQLLFYLSGTAIWTFFSTCVTRNADLFKSNASVFSKVYFPRLTVSISSILTAMIRLGIQMLLVYVLCIYYQIKGVLTPHWLLSPILLLILVEIGVMGMGIGIIISSLTTKYRDLSILVTYGISLWMYVTPIVYPASELKSETLKTLIWINPVSSPVELFRYIVLGVGTVDIKWNIYSLIFTLVVTLLGIIVFNKVERTFVDTI